VTEVATLVIVIALVAAGGFAVGIIASRRIVRWEDRSEEADDPEP
jgi:hypothetical protein